MPDADTSTASVEQALFPAGSTLSTWAVLDGARDSAVYRALLASRLEFRCLYSGRLPRVLELAAPQLVELPPGHRLARELLGGAWGSSWGVFMRTRTPENLRHHLRKLLRVQAEGGRTLLFRFYDPRVLRAFLPMANAEQRTQLFAGVDTWFAEDGRSGARGVWAFSLDASGALLRRHVQAADVVAGTADTVPG